METLPEKTVYDADTGRMTTVSPDQQRRFHFLQQHIELATLVKAVALAEIADDKLYLAAVCSSFKEYAESSGLGVVSAKKYTQIGRRFRTLLPQIGEAKGYSGTLSATPNPTNIPPELQQFGGFGYKELLEFSRISEADFEEITQTGEIQLTDGRTFTLDDLKAMTARENQQLLKEYRTAKKRYHERISQLQEQVKKLKAEQKADRDNIEEAEHRLEEARQIERLHGARAAAYHQKRAALDRAFKLLTEARLEFFRVDITPDDADVLQEAARQFVATCSQMMYLGREHIDEVIAHLGTTPDFYDPTGYKPDLPPVVLDGVDQATGEVLYET
jgi:hypothetical protein